MTIDVGRVNNVPVMTMENLLAHAGGIDITTGVNDARTALATVDGAGPHHLPPGTYRIATNITLSSPFFRMPHAIIKPDNGVMVTVAAPTFGSDDAWIDTSAGGKVVFTPKSGMRPSPRWFKGKLDWDGAAGTNDAQAWQDLFAALINDPDSGWSVDLGVGKSLLTTGFQISTHATALHGRGRHASKFIFNPAADGAICTQFKRPVGDPIQEMFGGEIRDVAFASAPGNTVQKIAMDLVDTSEIDLVRVTVHNTWTSGALRRHDYPSIGLRFRGRELLSWRKLTIAADLPISVEANPNHLYNWDGIEGHGTYLLIQEPTQAAMRIASGSYVQNFVLGGSNVFTGGKDGIIFVNAPGASVACRSIRIENLRHESTLTAGGSLVAIVADTAQVLSTVLRNLQPTFNQNIKLRGCQNVLIELVTYSGATGKVVFDIDNCDYVRGIANSIQAGNYADFHDTTIVVECTANAAVGAVALSIAALSAPMALGTTLTFTGGKLATLTADAIPGATSLTVAPLAAGINNGDSATRVATMQRIYTMGEQTTVGVPPDFEYTKILTPAYVQQLQQEAFISIDAFSNPFQMGPAMGTVRCNVGSGPVEVYTPSAAAYPGAELTVKKTDASTTWDVTIHCIGGTIDGASTYVLHGAYPSATIRSNGANWDVVGKA